MTSPSLMSNIPPGHAITPSANPQRHQGGKPHSAVPWSRRVILCIWLLNVINTRDVTGISLHVLMVLGVTWRSSAGLSWGTRHIPWGGTSASKEYLRSPLRQAVPALTSSMRTCLIPQLGLCLAIPLSPICGNTLPLLCRRNLHCPRYPLPSTFLTGLPLTLVSQMGVTPQVFMSWRPLSQNRHPPTSQPILGVWDAQTWIVSLTSGWRITSWTKGEQWLTP